MKQAVQSCVSLLVAALVGPLASAGGGTDATLKTAPQTVPLDWSNAENWAEGTPADGAGATLAVRGEDANGYPCWVRFSQDVTLGHILRPADSVQPANLSSAEYQDCLQILWDQVTQDEATEYDPMNTAAGLKRKLGGAMLTMDSGAPDQPATIQHLVPSESMADKRFQFYIEPPIRLLSDLYIRYLGPAGATYGTGWVGAGLGNHADGAVYLSGGITEGVPGKGVTIDNPVYAAGNSYAYVPVFLGGRSSFTGPLNIAAGMVRLWGEDRFEGDCHALGANNAVNVTSGAGVLDLAGTHAGLDGNTLHLGGKPARTEMGTLINTNPDPLVPGEWAGPVVIDSATAIGGTSQMGASATVGGGDIVISGNVTGTADVDLLNKREVVLSGDNSGFSGNWNLKDGYLRLRGENPVGSGTLVFTGKSVADAYTCGTAYRFGASDDVDLSAVKYDVSGVSFRIDVAEGLEYHPAYGFKGLAQDKGSAGIYKSGCGTLRLSEANEYEPTAAARDWVQWLTIENGDVVFDYTENGGPKLAGTLGNGNEGTVGFGERSRLIVRGIPGVSDAWDGVNGVFNARVGCGAFATVRFENAEGGSKRNLFLLDRSTYSGSDESHPLGILNIEANADAWFLKTSETYCESQAEQAADYPSIRYPGEIWNGSTFTYSTDFVIESVKKHTGDIVGRKVLPVPDSDYATDFSTLSARATKTANSLVDVTPALCDAGSHSDVECAALRFNTPNGGTPLVLDLDGTAKIHSGVILVTQNMGDTPVVIRGGAIVRDPSERRIAQNLSIRILNFNTNATLTIESDLGENIGTLGGSLSVIGPGKTIFKGRFLGSGAICVNGGVLSCGDGKKLLASVRASGAQWDKSWAKFRETYLYGGGLIEFTENADWICSVDGDTQDGHGVINGWRPRIGASGGGFSVAEGKTLTLNTMDGWTREMRASASGAKFIKAGGGTISYANSVSSSGISAVDVGLSFDPSKRADVMSFELREGTIERPGDPMDNNLHADWIFGNWHATVMTLSNGVRMVGREFTTTRLTDCNSWAGDSGNAVRIVIPDGVTATVDRHSTSASKPGELNLVQRNVQASGVRGGGLWAGSGTLVITNSLSSKGSDFGGFCNRLFSGVVKDYCGEGDLDASGALRNTGYGVNFKNASFEIASDCGWYVGYSVDGALPFRLGGLDGDGTVSAGWYATPYWVSPRIGGDDGKTHDFSGLLKIARRDGGVGEFVKVGSNVQRVSGDANDVQTSTRVVDGTLVLGHIRALDSVSSPTEYNNIYIGGGETTAGMNPCFLVDCGDVELPNKVKVLGCADGVTPVVGAKSGEVTIADLTVSNACVFAAESGATAKFSKISMLDGARIAGQSGSGVVEIDGDLALSGSYDLAWGGTLAVGGVLNVSAGTKLHVQVPEGLDRNCRYTLISATGGIAGSFDVSEIVVPKGWLVQQRANSIVLSYSVGLMLLIR